jgi:hypothetical protein
MIGMLFQAPGARVAVSAGVGEGFGVGEAEGRGVLVWLISVAVAGITLCVMERYTAVSVCETLFWISSSVDMQADRSTNKRSIVIIFFMSFAFFQCQFVTLMIIPILACKK